MEEDSWLKLDLEKDFVGEIRLNLTAYAVEIDGTFQEGDETHTMTIEVSERTSMQHMH